MKLDTLINELVDLKEAGFGQANVWLKIGTEKKNISGVCNLVREQLAEIIIWSKVYEVKK